jgi:FkbM family methyltransferase
LGLYDKNTEVDYYSIANNTALSTLKLDYIKNVIDHLNLDSVELNKNIQKYKIQTRTLDSFNLQPDFIKIDVEGVGVEVLQGAEQTIMQYMPTIQIEKGHEGDWLLSHDYVKIEEDLSIDEIISDHLYIHKSKVKN